MLSSTIVLRIPPKLQMTDDEFFEFCQINRDLRIERNKSGELLIMPPTGGTTGNRSGSVFGELYIWSRQDGTGICFDSSTGFKLSMGDKSPDASWIKLERWNALSQEQQDKFAPICPDFVVELRSASDNLKPLQEKMQEYMKEPGVRLGWLIDRKNRRVYIYRPDLPEECLENPATVSGDPVLPGFVLNMSKIW
ncbi:MAG: Uma2 family endonuclease [Microcoleus sp. PH2017_10_PVI_O_A]|uniref:Uma2 family endonuclease n=1 Tax=unclassified Microcoleus TaxID=2642155 RepID=UPI001DE0031A|nr:MULTISPECIES: Uma2 family endonuclease [unclassified Microcoleus]TAE83141.1 MAG: Uma2 family endonuclease [Oscillatoriales cyanobacterium]MCC3406338.1 Uma2 family endonuclease [Microcoleus sp. PH2017_10_PVI_O_A]MCC3460322.1 Uma2 family endonuclease [Microcoleus sp. PH2017_11_PCY_U_A]MCC3478855.1 Uma2 family endonuclease [Microcoleus sp. PH2017_12_PCY_D_A]MCC3559790.1 Uma2 family endonuclease [Microcoleus sp. PH2017_27_LUM_O_A]